MTIGLHPPHTPRAVCANLFIYKQLVRIRLLASCDAGRRLASRCHGNGGLSYPLAYIAVVLLPDSVLPIVVMLSSELPVLLIGIGLLQAMAVTVPEPSCYAVVAWEQKVSPDRV